jgi:hypothetical protein
MSNKLHSIKRETLDKESDYVAASSNRSGSAYICMRYTLAGLLRNSMHKLLSGAVTTHNTGRVLLGFGLL